MLLIEPQMKELSSLSFLSLAVETLVQCVCVALEQGEVVCLVRVCPWFSRYSLKDRINFASCRVLLSLLRSAFWMSLVAMTPSLRPLT